MTLQEIIVQMKVLEEAMSALLAAQPQYTQEQLDAKVADLNKQIEDLKAQLAAAAATAPAPAPAPEVPAVDLEAVKAEAAKAAVAAYKASVVEKLKAVRKDDDALLASLEEVEAPVAPATEEK